MTDEQLVCSWCSGTKRRPSVRLARPTLNDADRIMPAKWLGICDTCYRKRATNPFMRFKRLAGHRPEPDGGTS